MNGSNQMLAMLAHQKVEDYIFKAIIEIKEDPHFKLNPVIVQISSKPGFNDVGEVTDTKVYFPCKFSNPSKAKKGTYIRVIDWKVDVDNARLEIEDFQALSAPDYKINRGSKKWDISRIKQTWESSFISHDIILVKNPVRCNRKSLEYLGIIPLTRQNARQINMSENEKQQQRCLEALKKTRASWQQRTNVNRG